MRLQAIAAGAALLVAACHASSLTPPVLPLIVRNPYLSVWLGNAREEPWTTWPMFWTGNSIGFSILASVQDGNSSTVYPLLGKAQDALNSSSKPYNLSYPTYLGAQYDASTTELSYTLPSPRGSDHDAAELRLSFLSPITPKSTLRQAIPASYLTVNATGDFDISIYLDLNGQWVSGNRGANITWSFHEPKGEEHVQLKTFKARRHHQLLYTENRQQAEWGELHFTGPSNVRHQCGTSAALRDHFAKHGSLKDKVDDKYRTIMDAEPVFAFSKTFHFGSTNSSKATSDSVLFTIAHIQDPITQYASARGLTFMRPLWKSYFPSDDELVSFHYQDYHHALALASNYSQQVLKDAYASGSSDYADLVSLSARQVLGATSFSGTPDNPLIFLKEISSNGNCQTVDVIFPSFPFFLYTQPRWLAYLLEPLLEHMGSGQYPNAYTMHDLGAHFPNLTGHPDGNDEYMPVEECGDILIMGLALVNSLMHGDGKAAGSVWSAMGKAKTVEEVQVISNGATPFALATELGTRDDIWGLDDSWGGIAGEHQARKWLGRTYRLWKQWTGYLVDYSLYPENQLCTDDFAGWMPLMSNLALKGIVGIRAMSEIADLMGEKKDAKYYRNISETYVDRWQEEGMSRDKGRAKFAYHWYGSWTTLYSLFADAILCFHPQSHDNDTLLSSAPSATQQQQPLGESKHRSTKNFIPHTIYTTQSDWYTTVLQKYGLPLDSRHLYTKSDWEFQAAAVASPPTRKAILDSVAQWVNETATDLPLTDWYKTEEDGGWPGGQFKARPVVGSFYSFLALGRSCGGANADVFGL